MVIKSFTIVLLGSIFLLSLGAVVASTSGRENRFTVVQKSSADTITRDQDMQLSVGLIYHGRKKFCVDNGKTEITFREIPGWKKVKRPSAATIGGPVKTCLRNGQTISYELNLDDYFTGITAGYVMLPFQVEVWEYGKKTPVTVTDSLPVFIR